MGYVKDRHITENIRTVSDIMFYTKQKQMEGMLINIDFKKAFDSVNWNFMIETLRHFNFGDSFIKWIRTFYNDITSCVNNNGKISRKFHLGRGVRQGDPISPYLFILMVEILASKIREEKNIKGIEVGNEEIKVLQYADDTTGCLSDVKSAKLFLHTVDIVTCLPPVYR